MDSRFFLYSLCAIAVVFFSGCDKDKEALEKLKTTYSSANFWDVIEDSDFLLSQGDYKYKSEASKVRRNAIEKVWSAARSYAIAGQHSEAKEYLRKLSLLASNDEVGQQANSWLKDYKVRSRINLVSAEAPDMWFDLATSLFQAPFPERPELVAAVFKGDKLVFKTQYAVDELSPQWNIAGEAVIKDNEELSLNLYDVEWTDEYEFLGSTNFRPLESNQQRLMVDCKLFSGKKATVVVNVTCENSAVLPK